MREQNDSWVIVGMHGVGAGTHNDFMTTEEHRQLIDWIAAQREWLDAVTMQEVALRG